MIRLGSRGVLQCSCTGSQGIILQTLISGYEESCIRILGVISRSGFGLVLAIEGDLGFRIPGFRVKESRIEGPWLRFGV